MKLSRPAQFAEHIQPICLANPAVTFHPGHQCVVTGWGKTNFSNAEAEDFPREVVVPIVPDEKCNSSRSYNGLITKNMVCAGLDEGGKDACQFDSGGPMVCKEGEHWIQTGVVSFGNGCAKPYYYGVYVDMQELSGWVKRIIQYMS